MNMPQEFRNSKYPFYRSYFLALITDRNKDEKNSSLQRLKVFILKENVL